MGDYCNAVLTGKRQVTDPHDQTKQIRRLDALATKLWDMAIAGDHQAIEWIWARLDGPAPVELTVKHRDERTIGIDFSAIDRIIDRYNAENGS